MALPTQKRTRRSRKNRAAHNRLKSVSLSRCGNCEKSVEPHRVCRNCGQYAGRQVIVKK